MPTETNCFKILGLEQLGAEYKVYQLAGLLRESPEYFANVQRVIDRLSRHMKAPITTFERSEDTFLLAPSEFAEPPSHITLTGTVANIRKTDEVVKLSFVNNSLEWDAARLRYLQFGFQSPLWRNPALWQPAAGQPFFFRKSIQTIGNLDLFEGFSVRVTQHPEGGFGVIVDLRRKLVSKTPLSGQITRDEIKKLKGRSCVYRMGNIWFEVSISGLSDQKIGEPSIPLNGKPVSLIEYLHSTSQKPVPEALANLSPEGHAIYYRTRGPEQRSAPAALCYLVEDTHGEAGAQFQRLTTIDPSIRSTTIQNIIARNLNSIPIAGANLSVSTRAARASSQSFKLPVLEFGQGKTLSVNSEIGYFSAINQYARDRLVLLDSRNAGFYDQSALARQYFIVPKSIFNSSGSQFLVELKAQLGSLYPTTGGYDPEVIVYDDLTGSRDFVGQSRAIQSALEQTTLLPGFALVMVHRHKKRERSADQLAAWVVKELSSRYQISASVIHTDMIRNSYTSRSSGEGIHYEVDERAKKRVTGYLRNVAINKVLLTNGKWPFVLKSRLNADIVIGIDVKNSTAAFTLIADGGRIIRLATSPSRQKEQLLRNQVSKYIEEMIRKERSSISLVPKHIVIHRDGRAWPDEINGIQDACEKLAVDGALNADWRLSVVNISKSAAAPLRMFRITKDTAGAENPVVGSWISIGQDDGFVCTTGAPFKIPGTANPLHIRRVHGEMSIEKCLQDVFSLSCLTWSRPEGAARLPLSIKLCDRSLFDEGTEVDEDQIAFGNDNFAEKSR